MNAKNEKILSVALRDLPIWLSKESNKARLYSDEKERIEALFENNSFSPLEVIQEVFACLRGPKTWFGKSGLHAVIGEDSSGWRMVRQAIEYNIYRQRIWVCSYVNRPFGWRPAEPDFTDLGLAMYSCFAMGDFYSAGKLGPYYLKIYAAEDLSGWCLNPGWVFACVLYAKWSKEEGALNEKLFYHLGPLADVFKFWDESDRLEFAIIKLLGHVDKIYRSVSLCIAM